MQTLQIHNIVKDVMSRTKGQNFPTFKDRVSSLGDSTYDKIFANVQTTEKGSLVLFRYGRYSDVFSGETEDFGSDWAQFWDAFNGVYRELRSITIDTDTLEIVTYPFNKFFNINELDETSQSEVERRIKEAKSIEFSDKLDGSMVVGRYWKGNFILTGSKSLDPEQSWRLKDSYNMLYASEGIQKMLRQNQDYTFIFESLTKADAHVVKYEEKDYGLHLIGVRDMRDYQMLSYREVLAMAQAYGVQTTKIFDKALDEILNSLDEKKSNEAEGFVANIDGWFLKIKFTDYAMMHGLISKISSINLLIRAIADNQLDDVISKIPQAYHSRIDAVVRVVMKYAAETEKQVMDFYNENKDLSVKDYAIKANTTLPKNIAGYAIAQFKNKPWNVLKRGNCGYKKLNEMGVDASNYIDIFNEES